MAQEVVLLCRVKDVRKGVRRLKDLEKYFAKSGNFVRMEVIHNTCHILEDRYEELLKKGGARIYIV